MWDNIFWSCASGITIATAYEVFFMWGYANDLLPFYLDWKKHPTWFVLTLIAIPFWSSIHFYLIHRLLHWKPLYKLAHAVHHRNDNIGPWSGISMHPIEHVIYLSSILIHTVVASHPVHIFFHTSWNTIGAAASHTGFESITIRGKPVLLLGSFHHQLHHRFHNIDANNPANPVHRAQVHRTPHGQAWCHYDPEEPMDRRERRHRWRVVEPTSIWNGCAYRIPQSYTELNLGQ